MIKRSVHQEDIIIINVNTLNTISKYIKQNLTIKERNREIQNHSWRFNPPSHQRKEYLDKNNA